MVHLIVPFVWKEKYMYNSWAGLMAWLTGRRLGPEGKWLEAEEQQVWAEGRVWTLGSGPKHEGFCSAY